MESSQEKQFLNDKEYSEGSNWNSLDSSIFFNHIQSESFYIFGTGVISERFYSAITKIGLFIRCNGFIVSRRESDSFHGLPVFEISDNTIKKDSLVCIAVHESILEDVKNALAINQIKNIMWIYPFLLEMELGSPVATGQKRDVMKLVSRLNPIFSLAIFYLAIEDIDRGNGVGSKAYRWLYLRGTGRESTEARLSKLINKVKEYKTHSDADYPIRIDEEHGIIADGAHRLLLARYFGKRSIICDLYRIDEVDYFNRMKWFLIDRNDLCDGYFDKQEIQLIDDTVKRLKTNRR